ncbi:hypothetical protein N9Y17_04660 [Gammaproteobacteria bacterium]|nr:hypothetical protein [Gammaproteobacteria bacterium]
MFDKLLNILSNTVVEEKLQNYIKSIKAFIEPIKNVLSDITLSYLLFRSFKVLALLPIWFLQVIFLPFCALSMLYYMTTVYNLYNEVFEKIPTCLSSYVSTFYYSQQLCNLIELIWIFTSILAAINLLDAPYFSYLFICQVTWIPWLLISLQAAYNHFDVIKSLYSDDNQYQPSTIFVDKLKNGIEENSNTKISNFDSENVSKITANTAK